MAAFTLNDKLGALFPEKDVVFQPQVHFYFLYAPIDFFSTLILSCRIFSKIFQCLASSELYSGSEQSICINISFVIFNEPIDQSIYYNKFQIIKLKLLVFHCPINSLQTESLYNFRLRVIFQGQITIIPLFAGTLNAIPHMHCLSPLFLLGEISCFRINPSSA